MPRPGKIYLTLDVNYHDDPDVLELSDLAQLLDIRAMATIKRLQSDGRLTHRQLERIAPDSAPDSGELIAELIASPLWTEIDPGTFERRSWLSGTTTAADIETMSLGGKRGNHVKWHVRARNLLRPEMRVLRSGGTDLAWRSGGDIGGESGRRSG